MTSKQKWMIATCSALAVFGFGTLLTCLSNVVLVNSTNDAICLLTFVGLLLVIRWT